ncbi:MAG: rhodanese-like domain-containing protein [Gemmatimonadetes bacterium]|jgi:sulfur-carrier protein adenylyltransferase/sulfurtransferase|nr:rhodanese-like domain-containing protein [Gemmatimonadota bacterium]
MDETAVPEISPTELKARLDAGDVPLLVDVREPFEQSIADLPEHGQVRIPTGDFMQRMGEVDAAREIVVYCRSGQRSEWAASLLKQKGATRVLNLRGGVLGWRAEVDPSLRAY